MAKLSDASALKEILYIGCPQVEPWELLSPVT